MLNVIIPMAGAGSRFRTAGYQDPKPLIPVHGVPMIQVVIDNLRPSRTHRFIFVVQEEHVRQYSLGERLAAWAPGSEMVTLDGVTDGAARTVLAAADLIDSDDPLMIANSDQYVDIHIDDYLEAFDGGEVDGFLMTMKATDPKWSFAELDDSGLVTRVVEKDPISNVATVGVYNFVRGSDFVSAGRAMINRGLRTNNEFYVAPVYNVLIEDGAVIRTYSLGNENRMMGLGTPSDLDAFLKRPVSKLTSERLLANR